MEQVRSELAKMRERMVMGQALLQALADVALTAPPGLEEQLDAIAVLAFRCVTSNLDDIERLLELTHSAVLAA